MTFVSPILSAAQEHSVTVVHVGSVVRQQWIVAQAKPVMQTTSAWHQHPQICPVRLLQTADLVNHAWLAPARSFKSSVSQTRNAALRSPVWMVSVTMTVRTTLIVLSATRVSRDFASLRPMLLLPVRQTLRVHRVRLAWMDSASASAVRTLNVET